MTLTVICASNQTIVFHEDEIYIYSTRIRVNLFYFCHSTDHIDTKLDYIFCGDSGI